MNLLLTILVSSLAMLTQPQGGDLTSITGALSKGDISSLSAYFDNNVEITTPAGEGMYTKAEATSILTKFFNAHKPSSYQQMHSGESDGAEYVIGNLSTGKGTFRVYLYMKQNAGKHVIKELRLDED